MRRRIILYCISIALALSFLGQSRCIASGANYNDTTVLVLSSTSPVMSNATLNGNTGIGTTTAQASLSVLGGNVGIGTLTADGGNLIINGGGNVGIGSAWPTAPFDINGTVRMTGFQLSQNAGTSYVLVSNSVGVGTWMPASTLLATSGATVAGSSGQLEYDKSGAFAGVVNSKANTNGNIGLGTTISANILDVKGGMAIGNAFAGYSSAPANGLLVQGNVGIGTSITSNGGLIVMGGNVGIGTFAPTQPFQVNSATSPFTIDTNGNVGIGKYTQWLGGLGTKGNVGIGTWVATARFQVGNNLFSIDQNSNVGIGTRTTTGGQLIVMGGNVGINTISPGAPFEVYSTNSTSPPLFETSNSEGTSNNGLAFYVGGSLNGYINTVQNVDAVANESMIFGTNNTEHMRIDNNGNVGIGTSSPVNMLDVYGGAALGSYAGINTAPANGLIVSGDIGVGTFTANSLLQINSGNVGIGTWTSVNALSVVGSVSVGSASYANTSAPAYGMLIQGNVGIGTTKATTAGLTVMNGDVGIGTWVPGYTLHVVGTAGLSSGTAWTSVSDIRLKDILGDYKRGLNEVMKLHTVRYVYKKNNALGLPAGRETIGFIAQEVQQVIPEAVGTGPGGYLNLNVDPIHWAMVNAVQELYKRWQKQDGELAERIKALESKLEELKARNKALHDKNRAMLKSLGV